MRLLSCFLLEYNNSFKPDPLGESAVLGVRAHV